MATAVGDIYEVAAVGRCFSQRIILTHHYRLNAINPDVSEYAASISLLNAVRDGGGGGDILESLYLDCLPNNYELQYWRCQLISPVRFAYVSANRNVTGTNATQAQTANLHGAITLRSSRAGREQHGTKKIGPCPDGIDVMNNGVFDAGYIAKLDLLGGSLVSDAVDALLGATWNPVIYNRSLAPYYSLALTWFTAPEVRTMHRRTVGVGE